MVSQQNDSIVTKLCFSRGILFAKNFSEVEIFNASFLNLLESRLSGWLVVLSDSSSENWADVGEKLNS